jgi:hypothetical protein
MSKLSLSLLFLIFSLNIFAEMTAEEIRRATIAHAERNLGEQIAEDLTMYSLGTKIIRPRLRPENLKDNFDQSHVCDCETGTLEGQIDLEAVARIWAPLKDQNNDLFNDVFNSLDQIKKIDEVFDPKTNDTKYMAYTMYLLKSFADLGDRRIDREDITLVLEILRDAYSLNIPPVVFSIINRVESIDVSTDNKGAKEIKINTSGTGFAVDLTSRDLLGPQEGKDVKLELFTIYNGATIKFYDDKWNNGRSASNVHHKIDSFLESRGMGTSKVNSFPKDQQQDAKAYAAKRDYPISPLYIEFKGLRANVDASGEPYDPVFQEAVILPGKEISSAQRKRNKSIRNPANRVTTNSLFLRVDVKYGILRPNIELPL